MLLGLPMTSISSARIPFYQRRSALAVAALPAAPAFTSSDRVLVVSPHPDDESLCCAGMIQQALLVGAEVHIVWLTSGDGFELDAVLTERILRPQGRGLQRLGERRIQEAKAAAAVLNIPGSNLHFLDYPDGGLQHLLAGYYDTPYTSGYTGLRAVTYAGAFMPGSAYTGANLERDLRAVVTMVAPSVVLAPSPEDHHPDHHAAGNLMLRILTQYSENVSGRWWIVHGGFGWPLPRGLHPELPLSPPPRGRDLPWQRNDLSPAQVAVKAEAINRHQSQIEVLRRFMEAFIRANELISLQPLPEQPPGKTP
jgi:LmbE family N-acetylglucosaminyl deacetylase